jgi:hypothetical protein
MCGFEFCWAESFGDKWCAIVDNWKICLMRVMGYGNIVWDFLILMLRLAVNITNC